MEKHKKQDFFSKNNFMFLTRIIMRNKVYFSGQNAGRPEGYTLDTTILQTGNGIPATYFKEENIMRIQHNIPALNAHRNLTNNNSSVSKNLEKLSSGYRINRAGDDAAGLAISEKMRAQITGLQTAQKNAEDGVSLVQTAEGALTEVHSMLNRMVELATQSANGTYSESNREEMQKEIDALTAEVNRISDTANFNGTKLFGGSGAGAVKTYEATGTVGGQPLTGQDQQATQTVTTAQWTDATTGKADGKFSFTVVDEAGTEHTFDVAVDTTQHKTIDQVIAELNKDDTLKSYGITLEKDNKNLKFTSGDAGSTAAYVKGVTFNGTGVDGTLGGATPTVGKDAGKTYNLNGFKAGDKITVNGKTYEHGKDGVTNLATLKAALEKDGMTLVDQGGNGQTVLFKEKPAADAGAAAKTTIKLHVGESSDEANTIEVTIDAMSAKSLGIDKVDITTVDGAKDAIDTINKAIDTVSSIRSSLGAMQNRLEHTINNLGVQTENITAAESRIRDVDMAKEMMAYTKNNILVQASQAMLAQANQVPQGVLQLLQ